MKKISLTSVILILAIACLRGEWDGETPAPVISAFKAEPISVNEGQPVTLSISGSDISSCKVLANDVELDGDLSLTATKTHIPDSLVTIYKAICIGPGGSHEVLSAEVNIIVADDIIEADSLFEIGKYFDVKAIENIAISADPSLELTDFTGKYQADIIPTLSAEVIYTSDDTKLASFDLSGSVVYGFEGNLDKATYNQICQDELKVSDALLKKAEFAVELESSEQRGGFKIPGKIHIDGFSAVTQSLENPVPQGSEWEVSFSLAETQIDYGYTYKDYGEARGQFIVPNSSDDSFSLLFSNTAVNRKPQPEGTVVVAKGTDPLPQYIPATSQFDPLDPLCSKRSTWEYCETEPGFKACDWHVNDPVSYKIPPKGSLNVTTQDVTVDCSEMFRHIADPLNLKSGWTVVANTPVFNGNPRNGPNDCRGEEIEPCKNYCIDRWKNYPWHLYEDSVWTLCKENPLYKDAVATMRADSAAQAMADQCQDITNTPTCKHAGDAISDLIDRELLLSDLKVHVERIKEAKESVGGYVIPITDRYFSDLELIMHYIERIDLGFGTLKKAYTDNSADWNLGMEKVTGKVMPVGFQSLADLRVTIDDYKNLLKEMKSLSAIKMVRHACVWSSKGRFRKFQDVRIYEVRKVEIDNSALSIKLKSTSPITVE